jgi:hypothetical protein
MLNKNVEIKRAQLHEGFKLKFQSWKQRLPYKSWTKDLFILLYCWDFSFFQTYISEFIDCYNRIRTRKKKEDEYLYLAEFSFFLLLFFFVFLCTQQCPFVCFLWNIHLYVDVTEDDLIKQKNILVYLIWKCLEE